MQMTIEQYEDAIIGVILEGRLDMQGTREIEQRFAFATSTRAMRLVIAYAGHTANGDYTIFELLESTTPEAARGLSGDLQGVGHAIYAIDGESVNVEDQKLALRQRSMQDLRLFPKE